MFSRGLEHWKCGHGCASWGLFNREWTGTRGDTGIDIVAEERATGEFCCIQCKFHLPVHTLSAPDLDSYFAALGDKRFSSGIIISTTDKWGPNAGKRLLNPCSDVNNGMRSNRDAPGDDDIADFQLNDLAFPATSCFGPCTCPFGPRIRHLGLHNDRFGLRTHPFAPRIDHFGLRNRCGDPCKGFADTLQALPHFHASLAGQVRA